MTLGVKLDLAQANCPRFPTAALLKLGPFSVPLWRDTLSGPRRIFGLVIQLTHQLPNPVDQPTLGGLTFIGDLPAYGGPPPWVDNSDLVLTWSLLNLIGCVQLACVKPSPRVHSEPESNSKVYLSYRAGCLLQDLNLRYHRERMMS